MAKKWLLSHIQVQMELILITQNDDVAYYTSMPPLNCHNNTDFNKTLLKFFNCNSNFAIESRTSKLI